MSQYANEFTGDELIEKLLSNAVDGVYESIVSSEEKLVGPKLVSEAALHEISSLIEWLNLEPDQEDSLLEAGDIPPPSTIDRNAKGVIKTRKLPSKNSIYKRLGSNGSNKSDDEGSMKSRQSQAPSRYSTSNKRRLLF